LRNTEEPSHLPENKKGEKKPSQLMTPKKKIKQSPHTFPSRQDVLLFFAIDVIGKKKKTGQL